MGNGALEWSTFVEGVNGRGDDRVAIIEHDQSLWVLLADGAGGLSGGDRAADLALGFVQASLDSEISSDLERVVESLDREIARDAAAGETTLVVVRVDNDSLRGVSVGDSEVWLLADGRTTRLTKEQCRKPLVGSGRARVTPFRLDHWRGTLVVGSDGLFKYSDRDRLVDAARGSGSLWALAPALVDEARLPSGALQDDISLAVVRRTPP